METGNGKQHLAVKKTPILQDNFQANKRWYLAQHYTEKYERVEYE